MAHYTHIDMMAQCDFSLAGRECEGVAGMVLHSSQRHPRSSLSTTRRVNRRSSRSATKRSTSGRRSRDSSNNRRQCNSSRRLSPRRELHASRGRGYTVK